jgi:hypothetical protein
VTAQQDNPNDADVQMPNGLDGLLPPPVPAALGLPDWFKGAMPPQAFNAVNARVGDTVKRCMGRCRVTL